MKKTGIAYMLKDNDYAMTFLLSLTIGEGLSVYRSFCKQMTTYRLSEITYRSGFFLRQGTLSIVNGLLFVYIFEIHG